MKQSIKKPLLVAGAAGIIGISSLGAAGLANAASTDSSGTSSSTSSSTGLSSLVDKIATKFGLNKADVQAVFDQDMADREAQHLTDLQTKLAGYVTDGKLTQDQSDQILAKYKEIQAQRESDRSTMDSLTDAERKAKMDTQRTAFDEWVTSSGIPAEYARLAMGGGHGFGFGGPGGDMAPPSDSSTSADSSST